MNVLEKLMGKLAKKAHDKGAPWSCAFCPVQIESKGKTLDQFVSDCLEHSRSAHNFK